MDDADNGEYNFYDVTGRVFQGVTDLEEFAKISGIFSLIKHRGIPYYVTTIEGRRHVLTQVYNEAGLKRKVLKVSGHQEREILDRVGRTN